MRHVCVENLGRRGLQKRETSTPGPVSGAARHVQASKGTPTQAEFAWVGHGDFQVRIVGKSERNIYRSKSFLSLASFATNQLTSLYATNSHPYMQLTTESERSP